MSDVERVLLECRYLLSLNKNFLEIANHLNISLDMVYSDINERLPKIDSILYKKIQKRLKNLSLS